MRCVVMQPTYLPWAGYFHLVASADVFVFLDDVQFEKSSWQSRNRILVKGEPHWITVPIKRLGLRQTIREVEINDREKWRKKHVMMLSQTYARHPCCRQMLDAVEPAIGDGETTLLAELTMALIRRVSEGLGLGARFLRASETGVQGRRTERLVRLCEHLGCDEYLSPAGSREYLEGDGDFARSTIRLTFQDYVPATYEQPGAAGFVSHLSIVDVLSSLGWSGTAEYVRH
ncbi:MAG: WbqC family protein [Deltaproteobacteria bacterium]|nr:WbqC family protein [Deltaproteobacteria bacterium]